MGCERSRTPSRPTSRLDATHALVLLAVAAAAVALATVAFERRDVRV
jgi:putative exporter of polyketide antibiotics